MNDKSLIYKAQELLQTHFIKLQRPWYKLSFSKLHMAYYWSK